MTSLDLHPEELLDKAARNAVTPEEQARLDAHLAACATCRFERRVRADFAAVQGDPGDVDDLVARAMSGAAVAAEASTTDPDAVRLGRRRRVGPLLIAAASLLGVASFAAVAQYAGLLPGLLAPKVEVPPAAPPREPRQRARPATASPATGPELPRVDAPSAEPGGDVTPAPGEVSPPVEPSSLVGRNTARRGAGTSAPGAEPVAPASAPRGNRGASPVVSAPASPPTSAPPPEADALALFTRAHEARVRGDPSAALRDLRELVVRFPAAPEAALAHAELGRLLLDRGEPASALESLEAYLASPHHLLDEDVRGARALALQRLGRADEERAAWEALLRDYPTGVFAPRARARLEALSP